MLITLLASTTYGYIYLLKFLYQLAIDHQQVELSFLPIITGIFTLPCWCGYLLIRIYLLYDSRFSENSTLYKIWHLGGLRKMYIPFVYIWLAGFVIIFYLIMLLPIWTLLALTIPHNQPKNIVDPSAQGYPLGVVILIAMVSICTMYPPEILLFIPELYLQLFKIIGEIVSIFFR